MYISFAHNVWQLFFWAEQKIKFLLPDFDWNLYSNNGAFYGQKKNKYKSINSTHSLTKSCHMK